MVRRAHHVIERCQSRHTHREFLAFLDTIDRQTPRRQDIHLILDNYGTHKHPLVKTWLTEHPRFHFHFTPTGASWLNLVERFFAERSPASACAEARSAA